MRTTDAGRVLTDPAIRVLERVCDRFRKTTACAPRIGAEIEFYLGQGPQKRGVRAVASCLPALLAAAFPSAAIRREEGEDQYEAALPPSDDPVRLAREIERLRVMISDISARSGCNATFLARPDLENPPSGLHLHVSLIDSSGINPYAKQPGADAETEAMRFSIAGLCELMNPSMIFFAPDERSYARFHQPFTHGPYKYANAPSTVSWGGNNRTVAIRIPSSTHDFESRHLEHRVPGSDANPASAIACVLAGIAFGIENRMPLTLGKVWGSASDETEGDRLVRSRAEAVARYLSCDVLQSWMDGHPPD